MAFLEQFSPEERELIVSLPYRAGLWVSNVDNDGGAEAGYKELDALESIIAEKGRGMFESAFVHEVIAETWARQNDWKKWSGSLDSVLDDCGKAIAVVGGKLNEKDLDAYRVNIMGIALSVAKAFREYDIGAPFFTKFFTEVKVMFDGFIHLLAHDKSWDAASALNVSYEEDIALSKLSKALHPGT